MGDQNIATVSPGFTKTCVANFVCQNYFRNLGKTRNAVRQNRYNKGILKNALVTDAMEERGETVQMFLGVGAGGGGGTERKRQRQRKRQRYRQRDRDRQRETESKRETGTRIEYTFEIIHILRHKALKTCIDL